jgi:YndJ-like protein
LIEIIIPKLLLALATGLLAPVLIQQLLVLRMFGTSIVWIAGLTSAFALITLDAGTLQSALVAPWFCITLYVAWVGVKRFAIWGRDDAGISLICVGCIYLSVGGIWLFSSTITSAFLGFFEPWKKLTAVHFHYAAFLLPVSIGLLSTGTRRERVPSLWFSVSSIVYLVAIALVAIGLNGIRLIELAGVSLFDLAGISMLTYLWYHKPDIKSGIVIFRTALFFGIAGLVISLMYSWRIGPLLSLDDMAKTHGLINGAILTPVLVCFAVLCRPRFDFARSIPVSKLKSKFFVGPTFFEPFKLDADKSPAGLVDDFRLFEREDFCVDEIDRRVIAFYEHTSRYQLRVEAKRAVWFKPVWDWLLGPLFKSCGQLDLPQMAKEISGTLIQLDPVKDGRSSPIGWIRIVSNSGEAVYLAAYSTHTSHDVAYMNIAFPLPSANMTSILFLSKGGNPGGIQLTTLHDENCNGDQGVYLATKFITIRLPLNETIHVWWDGELRARHEMWFLGLKYLTLDYQMNCEATAS